MRRNGAGDRVDIADHDRLGPRQLLERVSRLAMLVFVTFRPSYEPRWIGQPHVTLLVLNRLSERDSAALVNNLAHENHLPQAVRDQIVALADGVPLYLEELSRTVLPRSPQRHPGASSGRR